MRGRPKTELVLSDAEREQLTALTLRRKTAQALALRARIVLGCAEGLENQAVAAVQRVTPQTVSKWRARFVQQTGRAARCASARCAAQHRRCPRGCGDRPHAGVDP